MAPVLESLATNLVALNISGLRTLTDAGIAPLRQARKLEELHMANLGHITDESVIAIAENNPHLR